MEYDPEWDLNVLMLRQLLQIPYVKDLVKHLRRNFYFSARANKFSIRSRKDFGSLPAIICRACSRFRLSACESMKTKNLLLKAIGTFCSLLNHPIS